MLALLFTASVASAVCGVERVQVKLPLPRDATCAISKPIYLSINFADVIYIQANSILSSRNERTLADMSLSERSRPQGLHLSSKVPSPREALGTLTARLAKDARRVIKGFAHLCP